MKAHGAVANFQRLRMQPMCGLIIDVTGLPGYITEQLTFDFMR